MRARDVWTWLAMARLLVGGIALSIWIVGVTIDIPEVPALGLSAAVEAAVPRAVASVLRYVSRNLPLMRGLS